MWMEARDVPSLNSFATQCPYSAIPTDLENKGLLAPSAHIDHELVPTDGNVTSKSVIYVTASTGALDPVHQPWGTSHRLHGIRHAKDLPGR
ncbi:hypothetical protein GE21DRAFT_9094 [Neurospora crassa]|uniref:Uncharacterized protein n=1 Tax=Neurospora crassa (strain ATCC 24698 / 74-OR23-1A / CBS 708.71 / DSM 1257 / FGSC 987) TaxID=367110 RepID=Q7RXH1_NEUCR|nr:hypothetical protein NCU03879 [Neurospora crassa OR74A]EAA27316.1 hypothetical protein NCU03879 [Neurospora crassa OR74A]KHE80778.1 hypothetical protein GE21DRAFT_9094 [Neurospora crassa]|eukprot:XP_956552.1 hypothetical protein NCU03879 [Neurospora crassa OR74A]